MNPCGLHLHEKVLPFKALILLISQMFEEQFNSYNKILQIHVALGPVVQRPISANPGLNFNLGFLIPLLKSLFGIIFSVLFEVSNSHTLD